MPLSWPETPRAAAALQRRLASRVVIRPLPIPSLVAGLDCTEASPRLGRRPAGGELIAGAVLLDRAGNVAEVSIARCAAGMPYIPGLLSFREAPACLAVIACLSRRPGVLFLDGQGLAHPRRFGIACHVGLLADLPAIGVAKSILCGEVRGSLGRARGSARPLFDRGEKVGLALRTRDGVRPVYLSIGHCVDLASARRIALAWCAGYRIPEPTRLAHIAVTAARRGEDPEAAVRAAARPRPARLSRLVRK